MGNGSLIGLPSPTVRCLPFRIKQVENKMGPRSKLYIKYLAYKEYPILPINIIKDKGTYWSQMSAWHTNTLSSYEPMSHFKHTLKPRGIERQYIIIWMHLNITPTTFIITITNLTNGNDKHMTMTRNSRISSGHDGAAWTQHILIKHSNGIDR